MAIAEQLPNGASSSSVTKAVVTQVGQVGLGY